jgi:Recombinase
VRNPGQSLRQIAANLNERGIPTARGGEWSAMQVQRVMNRVVYVMGR